MCLVREWLRSFKLPPPARPPLRVLPSLPGQGGYRILAHVPNCPAIARSRRGTLLVLAIHLAFIHLLALSPATNASVSREEYSFEALQTEDGLPYNSITSMVQTRDGYLWVGTYNGLARFDGVRFVVFNSANTPELPSSRITSLCEDNQHCLWIGQETGEVSCYADGKFQRFNHGPSWPAGEIIDISTDNDGNTWLLNKSGRLSQLKDGNLTTIEESALIANDQVPSFAREKSGRLWVLYKTSLSYLKNGKLVTPAMFVSQNTNYIERACASGDGGLWVIGNGHIGKWNGDAWGADLGPVPWGKSTAMAMLETWSGELLVGTLQSGLFIVSKDGTFRQFTRQQGLSHDWIRSLYQDREGKIWVGTGGGGLNGLRVRSVSMARAPDAWNGRSVLSVCASARGGIWAGTEGAGLYHLSPADSDHFATPNGLRNEFDWSVLEDSKSNLWVGSWGGGLFRKKGDQFEPVTSIDTNTVITALYQSRDESLWLGSSAGLGHLTQDTFTWFTNREGPPLREVRTIVEDRNGVLWLGMLSGGLGRLDKGQLINFKKSDGLPVDSIWSLFAQSDGTLWIGTFGGGLCRFKDGRFSTISSQHGLPNNVICHIADDGQGNFWISSYGGIFRASIRDLNDCANGSIKTVFCFTYGRMDGLGTLECSGGFEPSGCRTPDGRLWFPTTKGLAVIDPANVRLNPLAPPTLIEEVTVDGKTAERPLPSLSGANRLEILPGRHRIEFRYTGLSLMAPEKVRFRYRLEGWEPDWMEAGVQRIAHYNYLNPGDYTFRVKACNNDGVWDPDGASLDIRVLPEFWQTWWFSTVTILAGVGLVGALARYRLNRRMKKLEHQRAIERERARIAKDIHDDLGASLTRITLLSQSGRSEAEDDHQSATCLNQIYHTARELTRAMDEIVWAVNPRHDTLDSLATYLGKFAQDFLSVAGIRCRLDVPIELPTWPMTAEVRHNLFLAFKEGLNNAVKHAGATEVRISLILIPGGFWVTVEDNGHGFDQPSLQAKSLLAPLAETLRFSSGNGLSNIKKRLEEIGGSFEIHSSPGTGTHLKFVVPVRP